ncbi:conserved hypothetical protein [Paraburkholderia ribeironis]|uniref:Uncharacterized protein n=1 Tax=Paraburkholderia ribeironis TaxID=1247936 RepID=A0A1N7RWU5_9BURK|nr:DUF6084 family protein [Paraburkholderia ribeironis]SIT39244.1 conserved hypothetical protein [Paraburkholderia ribeironis]
MAEADDVPDGRKTRHAPARWGTTLRPILWTHTAAVVPPFTGECMPAPPVPCSYDFNVAASQYFHGLEEGEIALRLQFSGTVFYRDGAGALQSAPIPLHNEATYRLPVALWRDMTTRNDPNGAWLCLRGDVFDRLARFRTRRGLTSREQAVTSLLDGLEEDIS